MSAICVTGSDWFEACRKRRAIPNALVRIENTATVWIAAGGSIAFRYCLKGARSKQQVTLFQRRLQAATILWSFSKHNASIGCFTAKQRNFTASLMRDRG